jgi:hypothetical protein
MTIATALPLSSPRLPEAAVVIEDKSFTTQIAPTILEALDLDPCSLETVREGGVEVLK